MGSLFLAPAGRALRRSIPRGSFPRSPRRFLNYGVVGWFQPKNYSSKYYLYPEAPQEFDTLREFKRLQEESARLVEQGKRFEQQEQRQKVYSYFIFSAYAALCLFGPDKKENLLEGNQTCKCNCKCVSSM
ncbi:unnamed protein product [Alopecurus aequalis]